MEVIFETGTLQKGNLFWEGYAAEKNGEHYIYSITWQKLKGGGTSARTVSEHRKIEGKNIGRANETTPEVQAKLEIQVKEREKRDQGFGDEGEAPPVLKLKPMLAHVFYDVIVEIFDKKGLIIGTKVKTKGQKAKIKWPCGLQPKFDGVRCLYDGEESWSRNSKPWVPHIYDHLEWDTNGTVLDGELVLPPNKGGFSQTLSAVTHYDPELSPWLQHYIYDCAPDGGNITERTPYIDRYNYLQDLFRQARHSGLLPPGVILVKTVECLSEEHAVALHDKCVSLGYEGAIVRNWQGVYGVDRRSYDLQKVKVFITEEFEIVDCMDGKGTDAEAIMYVCRIANTDTYFKVRPSGTIEDRKALWYKYCVGTYDPIGLMYTVKFQNWTDKGKPRFPTGLAVRNYE